MASISMASAKEPMDCEPELLMEPQFLPFGGETMPRSTPFPPRGEPKMTALSRNNFSRSGDRNASLTSIVLPSKQQDFSLDVISRGGTEGKTTWEGMIEEKLTRGLKFKSGTPSWSAPGDRRTQLIKEPAPYTLPQVKVKSRGNIVAPKQGRSFAVASECGGIERLRRTALHLKNSIQESRRAEVDLRARIQRVQREIREDRLMSADHKSELRRELGTRHTALRQQLTRTKIMSSNSISVVSSLKQNLRDQIHDEDNMERDIRLEEEVNVQLSLMGEMRRDLEHKQLLLRAARILTMDQHVKFLPTCITITKNADMDTVATECLLSSALGSNCGVGALQGVHQREMRINSFKDHPEKQALALRRCTAHVKNSLDKISRIKNCFMERVTDALSAYCELNESQVRLVRMLCRNIACSREVEKILTEEFLCLRKKVMSLGCISVPMWHCVRNGTSLLRPLELSLAHLSTEDHVEF